MSVDRTPVSPSRRMERGILTLFAAAATVIGVALAVPGVRRIAEIAADRAPLSLLTSGALPAEADGGGARIVAGSFESAAVIAAGLGDGARWLLASGAAVGAVTLAATAGAIWYFLLMLMWRRPFHRSLVVATQIAGAALLVGGILSAGLSGLGTMMAADELNPSAGDAFVVGFSFDPTVFLAGVGVLALSVVFDRGARLQDDTRGLV